MARAIVRMDDRLSNFFNAMRSTRTTFAIDRLIAIDVLGTPEVEPYKTLTCMLLFYYLAIFS